MKILFRYASVLFITLTLSKCVEKDRQTQHANIKFTCPMHPQIIQNASGTCPICGMDLVKMDASMGTDGAIMLNESQIKLANITTTLTRFDDMGGHTRLTGKVVLNEEQTEVISSRVQGRVEKLYVKEVGQLITRGQALYEIYSEPLLTLQQEYLLALRQAEELKEIRYETFLQASEKKLRLFGMGKEQVKQLAQQKKADSQIIFMAPVSGVVARVDASEGQYVSEGSALYRIEMLDRIWVEADLYPDETRLVKTGDIVQVRINGFESKPVDGQIIFISPEYRQGTEIITIRVVINNPNHNFLPGMQATVILMRSTMKVIVLPIEAVIHDARGSHVWILEKDGAFKPRMVTTGLEDSEKVEITSGLEEKENVAITGAYLLYSELVLKKGGDPMAGHHD